MRTLLFFLLVSAGLLAGCGGNDSPDQHESEDKQAIGTEAIDPGTPTATDGGLDYIAEFLGKRPAEVNLWQTEPLRSELQQLLGDDFGFYTEIMQEAMPLKKDRVIYAIGIAPDHAIPGIGYLLVDTENDKVKVFGVFGDHKVEAQSRGEPLYLPQEVKDQVERILNLEDYEM